MTETEAKFSNRETIIMNPTKFLAHWLRYHPEIWLETKTWDDTCKNIPPGKILIEVALSGDPKNGVRYYMVDAKRYDSPFYTIDENFDEERELVKT